MVAIGLFICAFLVFQYAVSLRAEHTGESRWEASKTVLGVAFLIFVVLPAVLLTAFLFLVSQPKHQTDAQINATQATTSNDLPKLVKPAFTPEDDAQIKKWAADMHMTTEQFLAQGKKSASQPTAQVAPPAQKGVMDGIISDLSAAQAAAPAQKDTLP